MKYSFVKNISPVIIFPVLLLLSSCKIEPVQDPNNPSLDHLSTNPTIGEIQNLVTGTESGMRTDMAFYWDDVGMLGREFYHFSTSDPRYTSDMSEKAQPFWTTTHFIPQGPIMRHTLLLKTPTFY